MNWFSLSGEINRVTFIIRLLIIWFVPALLFFLASELIQDALGMKSYLISKSALEMVIMLLSSPSIMKRLRNINWSTKWVWIFIVLPVLNIRNFILFEWDLSVFRLYSITIFMIVISIFSLFLLFKKGNASIEADQP